MYICKQNKYMYKSRSLVIFHADLLKKTARRCVLCVLVWKPWRNWRQMWKESTHIPPVDVSERNSGNSPVEVGSLSHYFPGFIQPKGWLGMEFLKHQLRMEGR